jgi:hypothetical protein
MLQDICSSIIAGILIVESFISYHPLRPVSYLCTLSYFIYDSVANTLTSDYILHHGFSYLLMGNIYFNPYNDNVLSILLRIEFSTIAFLLMPYVNSYFKTPLSLLFVVLFYKFRIYDWYYMFKTYDFLPIQIIPLLGLYILNLYWFSIIIKKISKLLKLNAITITDKTYSYSMISSGILTIYTIFQELRIVYIMSILLVMLGCLFHKEISFWYNISEPSWYNNSELLWDLIIFHNYYTGYMYVLSKQFINCLLHILYISSIQYKSKIIPLYIAVIGVQIIQTPSIELFTFFLCLLIGHVIKPLYEMTDHVSYLLLLGYSYSIYSQV